LSSVSKPYSGQSIKVALEYEPTPLGLQAIDSHFFDATGINAQYEIKPYLLHLGDITLVARLASPAYDAYDCDYQDVSSFKDHILSPTDLAEKYPDLTFSSFNPQDFQKRAWSLLATYPPTGVEGINVSPAASAKTLFVPFNMDVMIQFYRRDAFQSAGITSPPMTWDEYFKDIKAVNNTPQARFGTANQAGPFVSVVFEFLNHLSSSGGKLWNYDGHQLTSALDSPEALEGLQNYVKSVPYSDPGSPTFTWDEVNVDLEHGLVATATQFNSFEYFVDDPYRSTVVGNVGFSQNPAGKAGSFSTYGGSGIGVSRYSQHPEAAWLWLQWATSLGTQETLFLNQFRAFPSRLAVFDQSNVRAALATDRFEASRVANGVWNGDRVTTLVPFPKWTNVLDSLSYHLTNAMSLAETPQTALSGALSKIAGWGTLTF
jgi:multiple sugar transport system substrate-binding protein